MLARCSAHDVLPSTPGVMHVYSQRYTCITLGVMQGWSWLFSGIRSYIAVSHMICMSYICHMLLSAVSRATRFMQINTPTHLLQVVLY